MAAVMHTLLIKDETLGGGVAKPARTLVFEKLRVSVRDIIVERVRGEVDAYNEKAHDTFFGLVQPTGAEVALNGYHMRSRRLIDAEEQIKAALAAFAKNAFFVLVDDMQALSLDQVVVLDRTSEVSFVKLTPLVGG